MRPIFRRSIYGVLIFAWLGVVAIGGWRLWKFDSTAGAAAIAPASWPAGTALQRDARLDTLILMVHPQCACSRATLDELDRLMADCHGKLATTVAVVRPPGMPAGWEKTDLWHTAAAISGVRVVSDIDGKEAVRFGAATSGQAFLYSSDGRLLFAGGITESRGHSGDNAGRSAITALVLGSAYLQSMAAVSTPVYGCSLFNVPSVLGKGANPSCHQ